MSVIEPNVMMMNEKVVTSQLVMSKILLERLLVRKDSKLVVMQAILQQQTKELEKTERKISDCENIFGFKYLLQLHKIYSTFAWIGVCGISRAKVFIELSDEGNKVRILNCSAWVDLEDPTHQF